MKKQMKLGTKIALGFTSLIIIAVALGGLAVWNMNAVKTDATTLSKETVPAVGVANEVERESLATMYEMRGYAYTEEQKFLDAGKKNLEEVKKALNDAKSLADRSTSLAELKKAAEAAEAKVHEYEQLVGETVKVTAALEKDRKAMDVAAARYMKESSDYLENQTKRLEDEIRALSVAGASTQPTKSGATSSVSAELLDRSNKINTATDIIDLGNAIRIGNWRAQAERDPELFRAAQKRFEEVDKKFAELRTTTKLEMNLKQIDACKAAGKAYNDAMTSFLSNWLAREELAKKRGQTADAVLEQAKSTALMGMKNAGGMTEKAASSLGTASTTMIIGLSIGVLIGIVLAWGIARSITKPVIRIAGVLTAGSHQTSSAATQVSASSQSLAQGAAEQAAALEETTSSLEEMSSMTRKNSDTAQQAATLASESQKAASRGNEAMGKMSSAIAEIQKSATETAKIIKVIDEIAFQTNLLALNAAVEAARAGEAGKGFAVVAEEVRNLAMRSAEAAKNTSSLIEESVGSAKNGVAISVEVGKMLEEITGSATKVATLVGEIAASSAEQSQGIEQVNKAVSQMDKVTQSNAAGAEESAAAAEELSSQAEQVAAIVRELTALVNGVNKSGGDEDDHRQPTRQFKQTPASHAAASSAHGPTSAGNAERMIPLDGASKGKHADFSEFSKAA